MQVAPPETRYDADLLIAEARRHARRRRMASAGIVAVVAGAVVAGYLVSRPGGSTAPSAAPSGHAPGSRAAPIARTLNQPATLAVGRHGVLYIADDTRNMIFARHASGRITVVAGTGVRGFSGDGHLAIHAELNDPVGMIYDRSSRTLYVADSGNNRVRAIGADGVIRTVAGSGRSGWVPSNTPARHAQPSDPVALALSPHGRLYVSDELEVLRLNRRGIFTRIAGLPRSEGTIGVGGPALRAATDSANGLAFDRRGDLYLTGFATKNLLAISPGGRMLELASVYARGNEGIVTAPDGSVIVSDTQQIYRYTSLEHRQLLINFSRTGTIDGIRAIVATGITINHRGTILIDTSNRDGYTNRTSILALSPTTHTVHVIWEQPHAARRRAS
jgi:sugar lactone lactonase YvrE